MAALPDPVGEVVRGSTLPNGLDLRQVRVPLGVVGIIYEARPNVTVDAAALCLKSGNAVLLRGSSSAYASNTALVAVLRDARRRRPGCPPTRSSWCRARAGSRSQELMRARGLVDVLIPRGGAALIRTVVEDSTVPVIETGIGNCHVYVDARRRPRHGACAILVNSKAPAAERLQRRRDRCWCTRPSPTPSCRARWPRWREAGVTVHGDARSWHGGRRRRRPCVPATDEDWETEYLSLRHRGGRGGLAWTPRSRTSGRWSSGPHRGDRDPLDQAAARRFTPLVDSAAVMVNASTRFTDGGQFGFGAEIGISTQKLHARGPMGLPELTSTKYVVTGDGPHPLTGALPGLREAHPGLPWTRV